MRVCVLYSSVHPFLRFLFFSVFVSIVAAPEDYAFSCAKWFPLPFTFVARYSTRFSRFFLCVFLGLYGTCAFNLLLFRLVSKKGLFHVSFLNLCTFILGVYQTTGLELEHNSRDNGRARVSASSGGYVVNCLQSWKRRG